MSSPLSYELCDGVARVAMDDGKVNAMSVAMLDGLHDAFARAEADEAVVLLIGRPGCFSAGFDLKCLGQGGEEAGRMLRRGAELAERVLGFPRPVVAACTGHAYPMGAFLLLSADRRIGAAGEFRIGLNEVMIGLTLPHFAVEIARQRLAPAYFQRTVTGDLYGPAEAASAGFLDEVVAAERVVPRALEVARGLTAVHAVQHRETKQRVRGHALEALRAAMERDRAGLAGDERRP